jgi:hypothetical protein
MGDGTVSFESIKIENFEQMIIRETKDWVKEASKSK